MERGCCLVFCGGVFLFSLFGFGAGFLLSKLFVVGFSWFLCVLFLVGCVWLVVLFSESFISLFCFCYCWPTSEDWLTFFFSWDEV